MNFDQLGQAWREENQAASAEQRLEQYVSTTRTVERFTGAIFRRDLIESAACLFIFYVFGSTLFNKELIAATAMPAVFVFGVVVNLLGAAYVLYRLHRTRMSTPQPKVDAPMREYVELELTRVEKQMSLLRSVHLWYLGPFYVGVNAMFLSYDGFCLEFLLAATIVTVLYAFIYAMNQLAASTSMQAIRDELVWIQDQLEGKEEPATNPYDPVAADRRVHRFVFRWFIILLAVGLGGFLLLWWFDVEYPKRSPFDGVRWQDASPEVQLEDQWFRLVAIDGVQADQIVNFCQTTYGERRWRQRFEEDLVEVLTRMGNEPGEVVRLLVTPIGSELEFMQKTVPMTEAQRWAIKRAAMAREKAGLPRSDVHPDSRTPPGAEP